MSAGAEAFFANDGGWFSGDAGRVASGLVESETSGTRGTEARCIVESHATHAETEGATGANEPSESRKTKGYRRPVT